MASLPALAALAVLTAVMVGLVGYEAVRYANVRDAVRHRQEIATSDAAPDVE